MCSKDAITAQVTSDQILKLKFYSHFQVALHHSCLLLASCSPPLARVKQPSSQARNQAGLKGVGEMLMVNFHPDQLPEHGCMGFLSAGVGLEKALGGESSKDKGKGKPRHSAHLH